MDSPFTSDESSETDGRSPAAASCSTPGFISSVDYSRTISEVSSFSERSGSEEQAAAAAAAWPAANLRVRARPVLTKVGMKQHADLPGGDGGEEGGGGGGAIELVKERFSKLLLGEDMSGSGKGVCAAVAISNAITNLYGTA